MSAQWTIVVATRDECVGAGCATGRWFLRKTALQIVKATIAEASRGDTSGCCKGGDSAEISVWKVVRESFASCEKMWFIEEQ